MTPEKISYLEAGVLVELSRKDPAVFPVQASGLLFSETLYSEPDDKFLATDEEIEIIFERLERAGLVYGYHDPHARPRYVLTDAGKGRVANDREIKNTLIHKYSVLGNAWLIEVLNNLESTEPTNDKSEEIESGIEDDPLPKTSGAPFTLDVSVLGGGDFLADAPASDRVVPLNHNSPNYKKAVSSLEKVIQEFRDDHHLDNELGHEKGALLKALEGGRELLDDSTVNLRIGVALLIEPLKRIIEKYDQVLVGVSAAAALEIILKLFGLV